MRSKRILSAVLALVMALALVPAVSLAENIGELADEAANMNALDKVWAVLERAEADAMAAGADRAGVINAVYEAALNLDAVDADSFSDFTEDGFFFTVNGMYNAYNYRLSAGIAPSEAPADGGITVTNGTAAKGENSEDVLVVGPFYGGLDENFTDKYKEVAAEVAKETGGSLTVIEGRAASAEKIAEEFANNGVIFVDSHGNASNETSYINITTGDGLTTEDFEKGWAERLQDGVYGIDGRYIENYLNEKNKKLDNTFIWIGACEGMMASGKGTTGEALLRAGSAAVYGYSQSVTFAIDLNYYLPTFWRHMCDGLTAAESFELMKKECIVPDPFIGLAMPAYPVIMSDVDAFPENPDSLQTVKCTWGLFDNIKSTPLNRVSIGTKSANLKVGDSITIPLVREPMNASGYEVVCTASNSSVAFANANRRSIEITAASSGLTTITCKVLVDGREFYSEDITILVEPNAKLDNALNVENGLLQFGTKGYGRGKTENEYLAFYAYTEGGRTFAKSGVEMLNDVSSELSLCLRMKKGETLEFDYFYSTESYDYYIFTVNGEEVRRFSGEDGEWHEDKFTAEDDGIYEFRWIYEKDFYGEGGEDYIAVDNVRYSGTIDVPSISMGDPNGDGKVDMNDALATLRCSLGMIAFTPEQIKAADMTGDGLVTFNDALALLRLVLSMDD